MSEEKKIRIMFDAIAARYDLMNRVMTMGQDQKWRRFVVERAGDPRGGVVLDLATGTGDIAALIGTLYPECRVIGADFSLNMLKEAQKRFGTANINWHATDANVLPYKDGTFESVTFGYLLRNVDNVAVVLREVHRVLK
ncbi:MAG: class I SAM-dependent methyltransferase, partial [Desulfopila sp.]|nr:class I SAM-dependent methyltransferase [Desulfopila sp.]